MILMVVTVYMFFYLHSFDCILTAQSDYLSIRHISTVVMDFQPLGKITKQASTNPAKERKRGMRNYCACTNVSIAVSSRYIFITILFLREWLE